jgi:hypothetical protein
MQQKPPNVGDQAGKKRKKQTFLTFLKVLTG